MGGALSGWSTRRGDGSRKAWLFAIAHRQFIDQRRRAGRWRNVLAMLGGEPGAAPSAEETFVARSSLEAFDALAVDHRAVLLLVVVEGLTYQEAAHALAERNSTRLNHRSSCRTRMHFSSSK